MNNFLKRTLSGFVFVVLVIGSIWWQSYSFLAFFVVVAALAVREFHKHTNLQTDISVNVKYAVLGSIILFISSYLHAAAIIRYPIFSVYGLFVVFVFISEFYLRKSNPIHNWAYFILGQAFIALPFSLLNFVAFIDEATYKPLILIAVFVTIWVNDTGAYLVGITFGKHRLFERVSPKKSWEGFFGGALAALGSGYVFSLFIPEISWVQWLIFSEIVVVFGTFGDLIESLMKRTVHIKDSGNIIPGHGGVLDRFDSMLLAAPVIFIYLSFLF